MKLGTHLVTSACVGAVIGIISGCSLHTTAFLAGLGILINYLMDLGHTCSRYGPKRSVFTHSVLGVVVISVALATAMRFLSTYLGVAIVQTHLVLALVAGGLTHLLLDSLTEGGIYLLWPLKKKRYALAHLDYDNPIANMLATIAFVVPTLYLMYHFYGGEVAKWLVRLESFR